MRDLDWAWLAGIFEGEGCCSLTGKSGVETRIFMTDRDIIERIDRLCPSERRRITVRTPPNRKVQYGWVRSDRDEVRAFLEGVLPFLGERRGERVRLALERLDKNLGAKHKRTHCKYGHPLSGDNLYVAALTGARSCQICRTRRGNEREERARAERAANPKKRGSPFQTVCARGHPMDDDNAYVIPKTGKRRCKTCRRMRDRGELP
jgi:hypothetical protein